MSDATAPRESLRLGSLWPPPQPARSTRAVYELKRIDSDYFAGRVALGAA